MMLRDLLARFMSKRPPEYVAEKCGHRTLQTGDISAFGQTTTTKMPINGNDTVDYCLKCIGNMAIQCAWCGEAIFIGDPITLYTPMEHFVIPDYAVVYRQEPMLLVGCLSLNCAFTGGDRAGFWVPNENGEGGVLRLKSPIETVLSGEAPDGIVINDLSDMREAFASNNP